MILIHHNDLDGRCAAAIVLRKHPSAETIEMKYGDAIPWEKLEGQDVWIVDFCLQPFEEMVKLQEVAKSITWIDHHKSALEQAANADFMCNGVQEEGRAGCELAWAYCFDGKPEPRAVTLLGRFDVWDHADPEVLPFQFGMLAAPDSTPTAKAWKRLLDDDGAVVDLVLHHGPVVRQYQENISREKAESSSFEMEFEGKRAICMNGAGKGSLAFDSVFDPKRHDIMLNFGWHGSSWTVSLYSRDGKPDVSKICAAHGGGGHPGAGGFQCAKLPFELPTKA
jgi:oligoribonuclease NrnB/cAMP/cGMP phosphodiesterase (DHH superfamily)